MTIVGWIRLDDNIFIVNNLNDKLKTTISPFLLLPYWISDTEMLRVL